MAIHSIRNTNVYEIRVEGHLTDRWSEWFEGLEICNDNGYTILRGSFTDQAALLGALAKVHSLNLRLVSVQRALEED